MKYSDYRVWTGWMGLGAAVLLAACGNVEEVSRQQEPGSIPVRVVTLRLTSLERFYETAGAVRARQRAVLASKVQATLLSVPVRLGDSVERGQLLVELDNSEFQAEVRGAQASLEAAGNAVSQAQRAQEAAEADAHLAAVTFRRFQQLFEKRSVSEQEFDQAQAREKAAQAGVAMSAARLQQAQAEREAASAALEAARIRESYTRITAPFAGIVAEKAVDPGTVAMPGMPLVTIEDSAGYQLEVSVPESHLRAAEVGNSVRVSIPAIRMDTQARVIEMEPGAEPGSRSSLVRIALPDADGLRSGLFGRAFFSLGPSDLLVVPQEAVMRQGQLQSVFVVAEGRARRRLVTLGRNYDGAVEVLSGLTAGEQVAITDLGSLTDGAPVEIQP